MRILQVVHGFPPRNRAGTEVYTYNLSKELSKNDEVYVFYPAKDTSREGYSLTRYDDNGLHRIEVTNKQPRSSVLIKHESTYRNVRVDEKFEALVDEINPDIVHFQHLMGLSASLIEIACQRELATVLTLHDFWFICPTVKLLKDDYTVCEGPDEQGGNCFRCWNRSQAEALAQFLHRYSIPKWSSKVFELNLMAINSRKKIRKRKDYMRSVLRRVDRLVAPSIFLRDMFIKYGIPEHKIIHSSNGYNLGSFDGFTRGRNRGLVFGFVGGLARAKGVHVLVEAFNMIGRENVVLRVYGNYDPNSSRCRQLRAGIQTDDIEFMGRFADVREPYSEMAILVFPSIWYENCPLAIQEAFATRTPVIASNIGALPEFVRDGENGLLFEAGNPRDLAEKMSIVLDNPELVDEFAENIRPVRSIEDQAREVKRIYEELCS